MKKLKELSENDQIILCAVVLALAGAGLSTLFFLQYIKWNNTFLTIMTAILSFAYMIGSIVLLEKMNSAIDPNWKLPILFPLSHITIVFLVLLFLMHKQIPENPMRILDCLMWSIYTMPSFIIVIVLAVLVFAALGYAG